jgi:xanthine dehydrogenase accessory factor
MFDNYLTAIKGGGDIASGIACRLFRSGFPVFITELESPLVVRRAVAFAQAIFSGETEVEGIKAVKVKSPEAVIPVIKKGAIPVITDREASCFNDLKPDIVIDGIMAKRNTGTTLRDADFVIGIGPGFTAGIDVHCVIETIRGHNMGRIIHEGTACEDTSAPAPVMGYSVERLLRAPCTGIVRINRDIGEKVISGETVAVIGDVHVKAQIPGVLRGIVHNGVYLEEGEKLGDIDPRGIKEYCFSVSDKSLAVGGGVLETILNYINLDSDHHLLQVYRPELI